MAKWNEVLAKVKKYNHSLSFILRVCEPRGLSGNQLCLAFKYKFHKDRVNDPKIKEIIEKVLAEVYGASLTIETVIDEALEVKGGLISSETNTQVDEAASADSASLSTSAKGVATAGKPASAKVTADKGKSDLIDNLLKTFGGRVIN